MPFQSRAQQRFAYGTHQPWAARWAKQTDFANLPEHKDAGTSAGPALSGPGGLLGTPGLGTTRRKGRRKWGQRLKDYSARAGETISGNLGRAQNGKFTRVGTPSSDAPPTFGKGPKKPRKARGRKGRAAAKPKQTPEQHAQATQAKRAQNAAAVAKRMAESDTGLSPSGSTALLAFAQGTPPDAQTGASLAQLGLAEQASDGSYRMTPTGHATVSAMQAGDYQRAVDAISRGTDAHGKRAQRQQAAAAKRQATQARRDATAARRAAKKQPAKATPKRTQSSAPAKNDPAANLARNLQRLSPTARRALGVADAPAPSAPAKARGKAASFTVYKDHAGQPRWIARTTTAYRDRDGEIISEAALDADSQRMMATKQFGPLRYWHIGQPDPTNLEAPWGPGVDIGMCDYSVVIGRTRIESGTFKNAAIARKMAAVADDHEMSPGFLYTPDQPDADGVFTSIRTFERSPVPRRYARAANLFTGFAVKEHAVQDYPDIVINGVVYEAIGIATKAQSPEDKAMFANMGSSGGSGGSGGKPSGGQGGLWNKGPDGKRTPQAGVVTKKKKRKPTAAEAQKRRDDDKARVQSEQRASRESHMPAELAATRQRILADQARRGGK